MIAHEKQGFFQKESFEWIKHCHMVASKVSLFVSVSNGVQPNKRIYIKKESVNSNIL